MSSGKEVLLWVVLATVFVAFVILFNQILFPFIAGMALAYFLNPVVVGASKLGINRSIAASLVLVSFGLVLGLLGLLIIPILQKQLGSLITQFPLMVEQMGVILSDLISRNPAALNLASGEIDGEALLGLVPRMATLVLLALSSIWQSGWALFNFLGLLVVTPVIAWYMLRDWDHFIERCDGWLPREYAETIRCQIGLIDGVLANYCRGQATLCLVLASGYSVALELVGLEYGLLVGLLVGAIAFIPYVSTVVGLSLAGGLAYLQSGGLEFVGVIAVVFVLGQMLEGYVLTPKLVGDRIGLNAVWVLFALLAGGSLFGFVGVLLAIPVAAVLGVLTRFLLSTYLASSLYSGSSKT